MQVRVRDDQVSRRIPHALPIAYEQPPIPGTWFLIAFGVVFGGLPFLLLGLIGRAQSHSALPLAIALVVFALFGAGCVFLGLVIRASRENFVVTESRVTYRRGGLFHDKAWEEPLSSYRGVLAQEQLVSRRRESYTIYQTVLKHSTLASRDIALFRAVYGAELEAETEAFSKLLKLPVLREGEGGAFLERAPGELDESLAQRAREGKVAAAFDFTQPIPGARLRLEHEPEGDVLVAPLGGAALLPIGLCVLAVGALVAYFRGYGPAVIAFIVGSVFLLFGLGQEALYVSSEGVRQEYRVLGKTWRGNSFVRAQAKDIFIFRETNSRREVVRVIADSGTIDVGQGLSGPERVWLKEYLIAKLAR